MDWGSEGCSKIWLDTPGSGRYIGSALKIKVTTHTKVIRKGPNGEIISSTETSPETSPATRACPNCGGEVLAEATTCAHCGATWQVKKKFTYQTTQKIAVPSGSLRKILFYLLLIALAASALYFLHSRGLI